MATDVEIVMFRTGVSADPEMIATLERMARKFENAQANVAQGLVDVGLDGPVTQFGVQQSFKISGFVFGAAICISVAGLIAIGIGIGLMF